MKIRNILMALSLISLAACDRYEGDIRVPAYLHIESIDVQDNAGDSWSQESGFFTSDIDAAQIILYVDGDTAETNLGTFTLPCTIPVLRTGTITKLRVVPVIRQNGIAASRISYPYYEPIRLTDVTLAADSVTSLGALHTTYISKSLMTVLWQEYFEPGPADVSLDSSVTRLVYTPDTVLSGYGCGVLRVPADKSIVSFWTDTTYHIDNANAYLYLEMEYCSDYEFELGLYNPEMQGGSNIFKSVYSFFPNADKGWQKIYLNLGRTWGQMANYPDIRLYFHVYNNDGKAGNIYLDNMKLLVR